MSKKVLLLLLLMMFNFYAHAETALKPFSSGSYQKILVNNIKKPFMFVIWSIDCSSCIKDMTLLSELHKEKPDLKIILLAADEFSTREQAKQLLNKYNLDTLENWIFSDENSEKLRFEIDPKWYGELPRTYFFDAAHQRTGISGVMSKKDYTEMLAKIQK